MNQTKAPLRHNSFFAYERFRYLKIASAALVPLSLLLVPSLRPREVVWGSGIAAFLLVLWLLFFGIRRRIYTTRAIPLRGWLSAHVYLGVLPLLIVPIHASFRFGANVHTLAFVLMATVIVSGMVGAALYAALPAQLASQAPGTFDERLDALAAIQARWRTAQARFPKDIAALMDKALSEELVGNILTRRRSASAPAIAALRALAAPGDDTSRLLVDIAEWDHRMNNIAREMRMRAWLHGWKIIHIPMAYAALVAILVHILIVVFYR